MKNARALQTDITRRFPGFLKENNKIIAVEWILFNT